MYFISKVDENGKLCVYGVMAIKNIIDCKINFQDGITNFLKKKYEPGVTVKTLIKHADIKN